MKRALQISIFVAVIATILAARGTIDGLARPRLSALRLAPMNEADRRISRIMGWRSDAPVMRDAAGRPLASWFPLGGYKIAVLFSSPSFKLVTATPVSFALDEEYRQGRKPQNSHPLSNRGKP